MIGDELVNELSDAIPVCSSVSSSPRFSCICGCINNSESDIIAEREVMQLIVLYGDRVCMSAYR